ncbi:MAG: hypothetical protein ACK58L_03265 [Planctomycetota bacterium]
MNVCTMLLMVVALLFPAGIVENATSSAEQDRCDALSDGGSLRPDTPTEIEIEEPELYVAGHLRFDAAGLTTCRLVFLSRDHFADADLDSSGCRPPPIAL